MRTATAFPQSGASRALWAQVNADAEGNAEDQKMLPKPTETGPESTTKLATTVVRLLPDPLVGVMRAVKASQVIQEAPSMGIGSAK
jgi:hypothetical protein